MTCYELTRQSDKAVQPKEITISSSLIIIGGLMKICEDFWVEFMRWAVPFNKVKPDADIYDVFVWLRQQQPGSTEYSASFLEKIDKEIERELGPWT